eukprot:5453401-Pleurochrysis_carterae.AAC.1
MESFRKRLGWEHQKEEMLQLVLSCFLEARVSSIGSLLWAGRAHAPSTTSLDGGRICAYFCHRRSDLHEQGVRQRRAMCPDEQVRVPHGAHVRRNAKTAKLERDAPEVRRKRASARNLKTETRDSGITFECAHARSRVIT